MRVLMKVEFPTEKANAGMKNGSMTKNIKAILDEQKPEAAYFTDSNGMRSGLFVIELKDAAQIPALAEPWFLAFDAKIEFKPVMRPEDLAKSEAAIQAAVKKYA